MNLSHVPAQPVVPFDFNSGNYLILNLTAGNPDLATLDLSDTAVFNAYVFGQLEAAGAPVGVGGYLEPRVIYRRSDHFQQGEPRSIHLGIDLWAAAGTPVFAPLDGVVHSFADNAHFGDYGPTIILEHHIEGEPLFSLYGHLSRASLVGLCAGKEIRAGEKLAEFGPYPENGDWPPHLHFQLMRDMLGQRGDFPGVCAERDREKYAEVCPNPNELLRIRGL